MSTVAQLDWSLPYLRAFGSRRTAQARHFAPPSKAISDELLSRAAREPTLFALHSQLDRITTLPDDWDGHGSSRPDASSVSNARQFLEDVYRQTVVASAQQTQERVTPGWQAPHISANEDGEIVFEWWNGNRKLTIYVGPRQLMYIKSWGPHVVLDMEDAVLLDNDIPAMWGWLFG